MKKAKYLFLILSVIINFSCNQPATEITKTDVKAEGIDRTVLPVKEPTYPAITELDARKATAPERFQVTAPEKAPNVVIVLIDDIGFGHSS
ncbi:MAG: hypothetical protein ACRC2O_07680, partial [Chitinophagaceae bacterium]